MKLNGKELVAGCVLKANNIKGYSNSIEKYCYVYEVRGNKAFISINYDTIKEVFDENNNNCCWHEGSILSAWHIHLYPIIGTDRNGDSVRMFDSVDCENLNGNYHKRIALKYIKSYRNNHHEDFFIVSADL